MPALVVFQPSELWGMKENIDEEASK